MLLQVILSNQHGCSLLSSRKGVLRFVQLQSASCAPQVTPEEMQDIVQALVSGNAGLAGRGYTGQGHFYKCPNGHPYIIGDCGGHKCQPALNVGLALEDHSISLPLAIHRL